MVGTRSKNTLGTLGCLVCLELDETMFFAGFRAGAVGLRKLDIVQGGSRIKTKHDNR